MEASLLSRVLWILFSTVGFAIVTIFVYVTFYIWSKHRKYAHIPGPKRGRYVASYLTFLYFYFIRTILKWTIHFTVYTFIMFYRGDLFVLVSSLETSLRYKKLTEVAVVFLRSC